MVGCPNEGAGACPNAGTDAVLGAGVAGVETSNTGAAGPKVGAGVDAPKGIELPPKVGADVDVAPNTDAVDGVVPKAGVGAGAGVCGQNAAAVVLKQQELYMLCPQSMRWLCSR